MRYTSQKVKIFQDKSIVYSEIFEGVLVDYKEYVYMCVVTLSASYPADQRDRVKLTRRVQSASLDILS